MRRELLGFSLLLFAVLATFFFESIFLGKLLFPLDILTAFPPWAHGRVVVQNPLLSDQVFQFYPWLLFSEARLRAGVLALWNPDVGGGLPHFANHQSALLFPSTWLYYLFPTTRVFVAMAVLKLGFAGVFSYLFFRAIRIGPFAATVAALAYTFCGFHIVWLNHPHSNVAVCLPALLFLAENLVVRRTAAAAVLLSLCVGAQFLGGHAPTSCHVLLTTSAYACFRVASSRGPGARRTCALFVVSLALGAAIAAIQLVPTLEYAYHSSELRERVILRSRLLDLNAPHLDVLALAVFPRAFGTPLADDYWGAVFGFNFNETNGAYVGVLPLLAALCALRYFRTDPRIRFFAVIGGIVLAVTCDLPVISNVINSLPVLNVLTNYRMSLVLAFSTCVLCGFGIDRLSHRRDRGDASRAATAAGALAMLVAVLGAVAHFRSDLVLAQMRKLLLWAEAHAAGTSSFTARGTWAVPFSQADAMPVAARYVDHLPAYLAAGALTLAASAAAIFVLGRQGRASPLAHTYVGLVIAADLLCFGRGYNPQVETPPRAVESRWLRLIRDDATRPRTLFLDGVAPSNLAMLLGVRDVEAYDAMDVRRYRELALLATSEERLQRGLETVSPEKRALLALLGVKYVVARHTQPWTEPPLLRDGEVSVYRNRGCLPRAYVVSKHRVVTEDRARLRAIGDPSFDARAEVLLEQAVNVPAGGIPGTATILEDSDGSVTVQTDTSTPAILVLGDSYYPGWRATVDGRETPIYPANHAFRATTVPTGRSTVRFYYDPASFRIGWATTAIALSLTAGTLLVAAGRRY